MNAIPQPQRDIKPTLPEGTGVRTRRWTREEYHRAAELGLFRPEERLELIQGDILVKMSPQNKPHFTAIMIGMASLQTTFGTDCFVRPQGPLRMSDASEPEPDLAVFPGSEEDYADHPTAQDALLVVEVSDMTLRYDLGRKAALYAAAGIRDYWVVSLNERVVYVHREPTKQEAGVVYGSVVRHDETDTLIPLAAPQSVLAVTDLLPRRQKEVTELLPESVPSDHGQE